MKQQHHKPKSQPDRHSLLNRQLLVVAAMMIFVSVLHLSEIFPGLYEIVERIAILRLHDTHRILLLVPVFYSAFFLGSRVGLLVLLTLLAVFLPHVFDDVQAGVWEHAVAEMAAVSAVGLLLIWLTAQLRNELQIKEKILGQLSASEQRYSVLMESANDAIVLINPKDAKIVAANYMAEHISGFSSDEIIGRKFNDFMVEDDQTNGQGIFRKISEDGYVVIDDLKVIRKDGTRVFTDLWAGFVPAEGKPVIQAILRDVSERKIFQQETVQRARQLAIVNKVSRSLTRSLDMDTVLEQALDQILGLAGMEQKAGIFLADEKGEMLQLAAHRGMSDDFVAQEQCVPRGDCLCGIALETGEFIYSRDSSHDSRHTRMTDASPHSHIILPLRSPEKVEGVMFLYPSIEQAIPEDTMGLLETVSDEIGLALHNARLFEVAQTERQRAEQYAVEANEAHQHLEDTYLRTIHSLVATLEGRDEYTGSHSERVKMIALQIAEQLGLPSTDREILTQAAELHDLGKVAIPDNILLKPGKLTPEEWDVMQTHPTRSVEMLRGLEFLKEAIPIIHTHHERYDGNGYPVGLKGDNIPLLARVLAVADSFDAITSDRPYRAGFSQQKAIEILRENAGKQWDPDIVEILISILNVPAKVAIS